MNGGGRVTRGPVTTRAAAALLGVAGLAGAAAAARIAGYRRRLERETRRTAVLAEIGRVATGRLGVQETADAVAAAVVPAIADLCLVETVDATAQRRRGGAFAGGDEALAAVMAREDDDGRLLSRLGVSSSVAVPLVARERTIGVLTLGTRRPRPALGPGDASYAATLAGRVALALDNAALSAELASAKAQLDTVLQAVDAGIIVRDRHGTAVFANQAAADLLKLPDPAAIVAATSQELMDLFDVYTEHGEPVDLAALPGTRVLRGEPQPEPMVVRNVVRATGEERWLLTKATAIMGADGRPQMAVNLVEDVTATKRGELAQRLLAEAARQVTEAEDLAGKLQAIADSAVPGFADWAAVDLVEGRRIRPVAIAHRSPEKVRLGWRLRTGWPVDPSDEQGVAGVVRTGLAQLIAEVTDDVLVARARDPEHLALLREVGLRSALVVPLVAGDEVLGAISFVSSTSRRFDDRDVRLAEDLGRQAGVAIRSAQLAEERAHIAHSLQAGLLPESLPALEGWDVAGVFRPAGRANEVGGDFYDVVCADGAWTVFIGDVVGKGAEAAAVTALVRHTLSAVIAVTGDPVTALEELNRRLRARRSPRPTLCTVALLATTGDDDVTVLSAGHPLPLLRRGAAVRPVGTTSPMLGVADRVAVAASTVRVRPGDQLLLFTDGVLDALGRGERFGEGRLVEAVQALDGATAADAARAVMAALDAFTAGEQNDDIALIGLARTGVPVAVEPGRSPGGR